MPAGYGFGLRPANESQGGSHNLRLCAHTTPLGRWAASSPIYGFIALLPRAAAQAGRHSAPEAEAFTAFRLPSLLTRPGLAHNSPSHPCGPACASGTRLCSSSNKVRSTHRPERRATWSGCAARHRQWGLAPAGLRRLEPACGTRACTTNGAGKALGGWLRRPFALPSSGASCGLARTRATPALDWRTLSERSEPTASAVSCAPGHKARAAQGSPSAARACASGPQRPPAQGLAACQTWAVRLRAARARSPVSAAPSARSPWEPRCRRRGCAGPATRCS